MFEGNDLLQLISRLRGSFYHRSDRYVVGRIFTGTANATCGNTTTETSIMPTGVGTLTLPANFWAVGKSLRLTMAGQMNKGTTSVTRKYTLLHGATTLATFTTAAGTTALANDGWETTLTVTCRTIGATGTLMTYGRVTHLSVSDADLSANATVTVDTTASAALDFKFKWSATDASNNMITTNVIVEALG